MIVQEVGISQGSFDTNLIEELAGKKQKCRQKKRFFYFFIFIFLSFFNNLF